jgi:hypothetical protein
MQIDHSQRQNDRLPRACQPIRGMGSPNGNSLDSGGLLSDDCVVLATIAIALRVLAAVSAGDPDDRADASATRPKQCGIIDNWNLASGKLGPKDAANGRVYRNDRLRLEVWVPDGWCINARDVFEWQVDYVTISHPDRQDARLHLGPYAPRKNAQFSSWRKWSAQRVQKAVPGKAQTLSGWPALWLPSTVAKSGRHRRTVETKAIIGLGVRSPNDGGYAYFAVLSWDLPFEGAQDFQNTAERMLGSLKVSAPPK